MPRRNDPFTSGKAGKYNPVKQTLFAMKAYNNLLSHFDDSQELNDQIREMQNYIDNHARKLAGNNIIKGMNQSDDAAVNRVITDPAVIKKARALCVKIRNKFAEYAEKPEWAAYRGILSYYKNLSDPDRGPYLDVLRNSAYMANLSDKLTLGLNPDDFAGKTQRLTSQRVIGAKTHEGPLTLIDKFYSEVNKLTELENERKTLVPGNEGAEADYLNRLSTEYENTIKAYQDIYDLTANVVNPQTGASEYDHDLGKNLNSFVNFTKGYDWTGQHGAIGQLKGQQQAIKNGWKLGELEILGCIGEMEAELSTKMHELELKNPDENHAAEIDDIVDRYEKYLKFKTKFDDFKNRIYSVKFDDNDNPDAEKLALTDKIERFIDENSEMIASFGDVNKYRRFIGHSKEVLREKVHFEEKLPEDLYTQKMYDDYNEFYIMKMGVNYQAFLNEKNPELCADIFDYRENTDELKVHTNPLGVCILETLAMMEEADNKITPSLMSVGAPSTDRLIPDDPNFKLTFKNWANGIHETYEEYLHDMDEDTRFAAPLIRFQSACTDSKNGNFMQANGENPFLGELFVQLTGAGPNLFVEKDNEVYKPHHEIREGLTAMGVLPHFMDMCDGTTELLETEYEKQRMMKKGWNDAAEKKYLSRIDNSYAKIISSFEKIYELPKEIQQNKTYTGNAISHLTGRYDNLDRDLFNTIEGMRWARQAIKNGWPAKDVNIMATFGMYVGSLNHAKCMLSDKIENMTAQGMQENVQKYKNQLEKIKEWEANNLDGLKNSLFNKKYTGPETTLDSIRQIMRFKNMVKKYSDLPESKKNLSSFDGVSNYYKERNNEAIAELRAKQSRYDRLRVPENANEDVPEWGNEFVSLASKADLKLPETIRNLQGQNGLTEEAIKEMTSKYIKARFLSSLPAINDQGYTDMGHYLHEETEKVLKEECDKYAEQCIAGLDLKDPRKLADYLEYGSHQAYFRDINERIKAGLSKNVTEMFISENTLKPDRIREVENDNDMRPKSLDSAYRGLDSATAVLGTDLYTGIRIDFSKMVAAKRKLEKEIKNNLKKDPPSFMPNDKKKLFELAQLEKKILEQMDKYINEKTQKRNNSAKHSLGKTGEARYEAMVEAKKSLKESARITKALIKNEFTNELYKVYKNPSYRVDVRGMEVESVVRSQKAAEAKAAAQQPVIEGAERNVNVPKEYKADDIYKAEEEFRKGISKNDPDYNNKMIDSALRTMFTAAVVKSKIKLTEDFAKKDSPWFNDFKARLSENDILDHTLKAAIKNKVSNNQLGTQDMMDAGNDAFKATFMNYKAAVMNTKGSKTEKLLQDIRNIDRLAKAAGVDETAIKNDVPTNANELKIAKRVLKRQNAMNNNM